MPVDASHQADPYHQQQQQQQQYNTHQQQYNDHHQQQYNDHNQQQYHDHHQQHTQQHGHAAAHEDIPLAGQAGQDLSAGQAQAQYTGGGGWLPDDYHHDYAAHYN